jgi:LacI family transcriptional regulator, repressor for deo operon, udp, cdd, tsx, nupC, and nupG
MGVVGFSNDYGSSLVEAGSTTIGQPTRKIGRLWAELLLDQIGTDASVWKPLIRVFEPELIVRGSTQKVGA